MATLTATQLNSIRGIPNNKTKTIQGTAIDMACRNFALTGTDSLDNVRTMINLFGIINTPVGNKRRRGGSSDLLLQSMIDTARSQGATNDEIEWAKKKREKYGRTESADEVEHVVAKVVKKAIARCGLNIVAGPTDYQIFMHWPEEDRFTDEHWWLDVAGYAVEIVPRWHDVKIYKRPANEHDGYLWIGFYITELHQAQVDRIVNVLDNGVLIDTPVGGWS